MALLWSGFQEAKRGYGDDSAQQRDKKNFNYQATYWRGFNYPWNFQTL
jgi:hypothetical protein